MFVKSLIFALAGIQLVLSAPQRVGDVNLDADMLDDVPGAAEIQVGVPAALDPVTTTQANAVTGTTATPMEHTTPRINNVTPTSAVNPNADINTGIGTGFNVHVGAGFKGNSLEALRQAANDIRMQVFNAVQQINGLGQQAIQQLNQQAQRLIQQTSQGGLNVAANTAQSVPGLPFPLVPGMINAGKVIGGLQGRLGVQVGARDQDNLGQGHSVAGIQATGQVSYPPMVYHPQLGFIRLPSVTANVQGSNGFNLMEVPQKFIQGAAKGVKAGIGGVHNVAVGVADAIKNTAFGLIDGSTNAATGILGVLGGQKKVNVGFDANLGQPVQGQFQVMYPQNYYG